MDDGEHTINGLICWDVNMLLRVQLKSFEFICITKIWQKRMIMSIQLCPSGYEFNEAFLLGSSDFESIDVADILCLLRIGGMKLRNNIDLRFINGSHM